MAEISCAYAVQQDASQNGVNWITLFRFARVPNIVCACEPRDSVHFLDGVKVNELLSVSVPKPVQPTRVFALQARPDRVVVPHLHIVMFLSDSERFF